jgi:hypothetical protein
MLPRTRFVALLLLVLSSLSTPLTSVKAAESPLLGTWQHQRDSSGWKVVAGGSATMQLDKGGRAKLIATAPNQAPMDVTGTWSEQNGRVTINLPNQFELTNQPFKLEGDTLTLPSQLSSDKPGSSTWVRMQPQGMDVVFVAFNRALEEGKGGASAAEEAAKVARKQEGVEKVEVVRGGIGLMVTLAPGGGLARSKGLLIFATKPAPLVKPVVQRPQQKSPLAGDPRSHIDALNPAGDPDVPHTKTALIIAPFQSMPYVAYSHAVWTKGDTDKPRFPSLFAETSTFAENGEDPAALAKLFRDAGYEVTRVIDDQATPGRIFRELQKRPSIVYIASHGGVFGVEEDLNAVACAPSLGARAEDKRPGYLKKQDVRELLSAMLDGEGLPKEARDGVGWSFTEHHNGLTFAFPILLPKFFEAALGGAGMPDGLVFLDACYSARYAALARAFKAKTFIGYNEAVAGWASARFSRYVFTNLVRKGHSAREAVARLRSLCNGAYVINLEDSIVSPVAKGSDIDLATEVTFVESWGSDFKPYPGISTEVLWLMRMARWANKDVNQGADTLGRCYAQYWRPPSKRPGLADQFCNQGLVGSHTPTEPEVEDARHLVSGKPTKPGGRFVIR